MEDIETKANSLRDARLKRIPLPPFVQNLNLEIALKILRKGIDLRLQQGEEITGVVLQTKNDFSYLTNQMSLLPGCNFSLKDCISPKISAHLVYYVDNKLEGPFDKIFEASSAMGLAFLISDSRFQSGLDISLAEKMADNFFSTYYLLGRKRLDIREMRSRPVRIALNFNHSKVRETEILGIESSFEGTLMVTPPGLVFSSHLFEPIPLKPDFISMVADYFGTLNFRVI